MLIFLISFVQGLMVIKGVTEKCRQRRHAQQGLPFTLFSASADSTILLGGLVTTLASSYCSSAQRLCCDSATRSLHV